MKKTILIIALILFAISAIAQTKIDTVISNAAYKSYYCKAIKEPLYVSYKLYKGGGDCDRAGFRFKNDTKLNTATQKDYAATGYDQGHLANAEDFASDCVKDEATFRFYNCLPQTANLNRGIWKKWETVIRKESQSDSLLVICGGTFENKKVIGDGVWVPTYCWKIVISLSSHKVLHCLYFTNNENAECKEITLTELIKTVKYKIQLPKIN